MESMLHGSEIAHGQKRITQEFKPLPRRYEISKQRSYHVQHTRLYPTVFWT